MRSNQSEVVLEKTFQIPSLALVRLRWSPAHSTSAQPKRTSCAGHQRTPQAHDQRQFSGRVALVRLRWSPAQVTRAQPSAQLALVTRASHRRTTSDTSLGEKRW